MHYRETGRYGRDPMAEEWNVAQADAIGNVHRFRVRILDETVRTDAADFIQLCVQATLGAMRDEPDAVARDRSQGR
jgi:hypothetical protein